MAKKKSSASTWARPTPSSPSWKAARSRSSPTRRATASPPASSRSPTRASASSATRPSGRRSPTRGGPIYSIKRFMGRRHNEVESEEKLVPYKIVGGPNDLVKVDIDGKQYTPPEISAMILRKLKEAAEAYLGPHRPQGGHHRPGVLQRRPAAGDHRRRPDRRLRHRVGDRGPQDAARRPSSGCASSTSRPPPRWRTASTRRRTRRSPSSTSAAARSTSPSSTSATASSRCKATNGDTHLGGDDFDQVLID